MKGLYVTDKNGPVVGDAKAILGVSLNTILCSLWLYVTDAVVSFPRGVVTVRY